METQTRDDHRTADEISRGFEAQIRKLRLLARNLQDPLAATLWDIIGPLAYWHDRLNEWYDRMTKN